MKICHDTVELTTDGRAVFMDITPMVKKKAAEFGIKNGLLTICSLHTTTGIFINEYQSALLEDLKGLLDKLISPTGYYFHNDPAWSDCDRKNAHSHLRALLLTQTLSLPIRDAELLLGQWQSIILAELDGPRHRTLEIHAMGE